MHNVLFGLIFLLVFGRHRSFCDTHALHLNFRWVSKQHISDLALLGLEISTYRAAAASQHENSQEDALVWNGRICIVRTIGSSLDLVMNYFLPGLILPHVVWMLVNLV